MAYIRATPDLICLPVATSPGTTSVEYNSEDGRRIQLWERLVGQTGWGKIDLSSIGGPIKGSFLSRPIAAGQVLEIAMWPADPVGFDPNKSPNTSSLVSKKVSAFNGRPPEPAWKLDELHAEVGGTYYYTVIANSIAPTRAKISISTSAPQADACGILRFGGGFVFEREDLQPGQVHALEVTGLVPGTGYYCIIQVYDDNGNARFLQRQFLTKSRSIGISISSLYVIDDGDNLNTGEAQFSFVVDEVPVPPDMTTVGTVLTSFRFPNSGEVSVDTGKWVPNFPTFQYQAGPKGGDWTLRITATGVESDRTNEVALKGTHILAPIGRNIESVTNRIFPLVVPKGTGSFSFSIQCMYSIVYV